MLMDIIYYILEKQPRERLSNARLTKLIYLSDWKSCLENGRQITNIKWFFDYYGPFVKDIEDAVASVPDLFYIEELNNGVFGGNKKIFGIKTKYQPNLRQEEADCIDFVLNKTLDLDFSKFIQYVYSTYPIYKTRKFENLNLKELADEYKNIKT